MRICKIEGCERKHDSRGYCSRHSSQMRRHGKIFRSRFDKNIISCKGDVCEMELYKGRNQQVFFARTIFNKKYLEEVKKLKWMITDYGYAFNERNKAFLHHIVLKKKNGLDVDHVDGDKLNNSDENLRYCTHLQNCWNRKSARGYCWDKRNKKWYASIMVNYKDIFLGRFEKEEDAKEARRDAEKKYYGDYAYQA